MQVGKKAVLPVPHRNFTFGIPKMLRPYFRFNRDLLKDLCRVAPPQTARHVSPVGSSGSQLVTGIESG